MILSLPSKTPPRVRSLLLSQFAAQTKRNTVGAIAIATTSPAATAASQTSAVPSILISSSSSFSTKSKEKKQTLEDYNAEKQKAKEYRTKLYNKKQQRIQSLPNRRPKPIRDISELEVATDDNVNTSGEKKYKRGIKKAQFRNWFETKKRNEEYYNRVAKRQCQKWKIKVGLMIERLPVVTRDQEEWEKDFLHMAAQLDRERAKIYPKEIQGVDNPMDSEVLTMEELFELLPEGFKPAPRITEDDKNNNIQTTNRKLSQRVYLSIRPDDEIGWSLPIATLNEKNANNESFVDCVKRYMKSNKMLQDLKLLYLSNCPMAVDVIPYKSSEDGNGAEIDERSEGGVYFGEKVFYMRVQWEEGDVNVDNKDSSKLDDWGWLARSEMVEKVKSEKGEDASLFYHYML
mmetsp:Transcript_447/g.693  ORF Transcript_447/g.693 Transcript_447/m.693 type:complete len:402 (-) Transcript_447:876-2081(-)|eukprot:CAMPEP_0203638176 /NCGR_PEP_ID=MMETSP0088-20131115/4279_1 /ASSEMBLY_ACC=CAM_ASM_001087 /TAXON_ID=426623 /ORGANISM="Chaetoceros affinis, Strain CCMP159" /LENGTH=401 /DNA_ID=CAMNT_0050492757 /DNA_START=97 /DNA_END=1302 /DNA_ORIENTATION=+